MRRDEQQSRVVARERDRRRRRRSVFRRGRREGGAVEKKRAAQRRRKQKTSRVFGVGFWLFRRRRRFVVGPDVHRNSSARVVRRNLRDAVRARSRAKKGAALRRLRRVSTHLGGLVARRHAPRFGRGGDVPRGGVASRGGDIRSAPLAPLDAYQVPSRDPARAERRGLVVPRRAQILVAVQRHFDVRFGDAGAPPGEVREHLRGDFLAQLRERARLGDLERERGAGHAGHAHAELDAHGGRRAL